VAPDEEYTADVCLTAPAGAGQVLGSDGLLGFYKRIEVLGTDRSKWTTTPLYR
jgi:hypothetical protein